MCIYNWAKRGVWFIKDILTEKSTFLNFSDFKEQFKIRGTYLDYMQLLKNIPRAWYEAIKDPTQELLCLLTVPPILISVKLLTTDQSGSKSIYIALNHCSFNYEPRVYRDGTG